MNLNEALADVEIAFWQLEFAIKLLTFCELKKMDPSEFDVDHLTVLDDGNLHFPTGHFSDADNIIRAAGVSVALAFGASALALDKAFDVAAIRPDPESDDGTVRLRTLIYMVRCAYAHGIAEPRWEAHNRYRRRITVKLDGASVHLDLEKLHGEGFEFEQIGGHASWYRIRNAAIRVLSESAGRSASS